jgi:hypothetical protein
MCLFTVHIIIYKHTHQVIVEEIVLVSLKRKNISFNYRKYYQYIQFQILNFLSEPDPAKFNNLKGFFLQIIKMKTKHNTLENITNSIT